MNRPKLSNTNFDLMMDKKIKERKNEQEDKIRPELVETRDLGDIKDLVIEEKPKERVSKVKGSKLSSNDSKKNSYLGQFEKKLSMMNDSQKNSRKSSLQNSKKFIVNKGSLNSKNDSLVNSK